MTPEEHELFDEIAGILEYDHELSREDAEQIARERLAERKEICQERK